MKIHDICLSLCPRLLKKKMIGGMRNKVNYSYKEKVEKRRLYNRIGTIFHSQLKLIESIVVLF